MWKWSRAGRMAAMVCACLVALAIGRTEVDAQTLPAPWSSQDIGSPVVAGSVAYDQGTFTISGAGTDIWGSSDQFRFVYQQISGDVDVIAHVDSITQADLWSKAGVMIRGSLAANSAHGFALVSAAKGMAFQRRTTTGGLTTNSYGPLVAAPRWVRIVRLGSKVYAYTSTDGATWTQFASDTISLGTTAYVGLAVTSHNAASLATAAVSQVAVIPLSLPAPQQSVDIGAPALASSVLYRLGVYDVRAAGADIWGTSDQFNYVYQPVSGDFEVAARVNSVTKTSSWAKTGVMVRETLSANSRHAYALLSASNGFAFQRRIDTGGFSFNTSGAASIFPGWVKLVRTGTLFEAFRSADGTTWVSMGSDVIPMTDSVYVGIATTSHNTATRTEALLESFSVTPRGGATNQPPLVSITSPANGTTVTAGTDVGVVAAASDSDGTIARVDFYAGTTLIASDTTAPYSATWPSVQAGTYTLTAVAVDNDGASTTSAAVGVTVSTVVNQPPSVTLTSPANGATYTAPASIILTASASDADGTISRVEFYVGTALLTTRTTAPYTYTWSGVGAGTYAIRAVAYDDKGASASSATSTVTVKAANVAPAVSLVSPANGATYTAPASVALSATASDSDGTIARVEFYAGTSLIATLTAAPYNYTWSNVAAGSYAIHAVAYDNAGASASSATNTITVSTSTTTAPTGVTFQKSPDHDTLVISYELRIFASGADPNIATPLARSNLGKPVPAANGDITVNQSAFFSALAPGSYVATVAAIGSAGSSQTSGVAFTR